ncbi:MAG: DegT/DnrJ/EryC1/StrS family aminotransferase [Phenylobacterium sp.]|uniref:DegT/DnrJ/EryC1/StrS family aminotransferase n=1 Tax=Phenylobacterium sp. TaxID=1871053 RepID=UPI002727216C|nr:DegT/DnrJ/EryC1/StrS family aminotransferase [Phenylobacterium sp.]MDO8409241.1 DegT/DnrJ/EryC1/StrS family aminotransferase [Phenylobacterium sp.]
MKFDIGWRSLLWATAGPPVRKARADRASLKLRQHFHQGTAVAGLSVRTIFDALLSELALPGGSTVLMSGVNVQNMADIVRQHQLEVRGVDIDLERLSPAAGALLDAQHDTGAQLCVVAHLFGSTNRISDAARLRERGVFVVEDAAQAFAAPYRGCTETDVTLYSFGPIKRCTALGGGVAVFQNADLAARVQARLDTYPQRSDIWYRRRALKYLVLKALSTPLAFAALHRSLAWLGRDPDEFLGGIARGFSGPSLVEALRARAPARLLALLAAQVTRTDDSSTRAELCREVLDGLPKGVRLGDAADTHAYWVLPVLAADPDSVVASLRRAGFDATRGATSLRALSPTDTPVATRLMANIVYVPHPIALDRHTRDRLRMAMAEALVS